MRKKVHNVNEHRPVGGRNSHDASVNRGKIKQTKTLDCKTVRIFAYSSTREHSDKRSGTTSGTRLKTVTETGERRVRLANAFPISLLILKKKTTVLQSRKTPLLYSKN